MRKHIFDSFRFEPNGAITMKDAVCRFIQEEIAFGRIKGGEKLPTIDEISGATGLTYGKARSVVERLEKEGYVHSRPYVGTVVLPRDGKVLRGRVLLVLPDVDTYRYHSVQLISTVGHKLTENGYAFSVATFSLDETDDMTFLKSELLRATDLVVAVHSTPKVQKALAESGVNHIFAYGDKPEFEDRPWIRFSPETAISHFASHCARSRVEHVVQVHLEKSNVLDAQNALARVGIDSSWITISPGNAGETRFDGAVRCAYETFATMPRSNIKGLFLFWNSYITQGAVTAFLDRGIRLPEDVKVVTLSDVGFAPVYTKSFTRFEVNPVRAGEKVADFAIAVLAKGRIPRPPKISPQYVFGATFPF